MKKIIVVAVLLLFAVNAYAGSGNISFMFARKQLNEDNFGAPENQPEFGVIFDYKAEEWPVSFAMDYLHSGKDADIFTSYESEIGVEERVAELHIGARKFWGEDEPIKLFLGGGLALVKAALETTEDSISEDSGIGAWINGGMYFIVEEYFYMSVEFRYSNAEVELYGDKTQVGGLHKVMSFGYRW